MTHICTIIPPDILRRISEKHPSKEVRDAAHNTVVETAKLSSGREHLARVLEYRGQGGSNVFTAIGQQARRVVDNCHHFRFATIAARNEKSPPSHDSAVNAAFDNSGIVRDFLKNVLGRNSIDDSGQDFVSWVNYGRNFQNAYYDGSKMTYGDGDGELFVDFTGSLDVAAHECFHGVTAHTAGLAYEGQSGALNESISDVFGVLCKQWHLGQTVDQADWLIGADIFTPAMKGDALRSLKAPGTAYDNDILGKDPQPAHMSGYRELPNDAANDNGGVHLFSGIPNHAAYLAAAAIGGKAWESIGPIWYAALKSAKPDCDFKTFANLTIMSVPVSAIDAMPAITKRKMIEDAWQQVGVLP